MSQQWDHYRKNCLVAQELGFFLDVSRVRFPVQYIAEMERAASLAMDAMEALEAGSIANADEGRMVGHYWLRAPQLASASVRAEITNAGNSIAAFAGRIQDGSLRGANGRFRHVIHIGIGGSSLGPQLLCESQKTAADSVEVHFLDNIDPDEIGALLGGKRLDLGQTLVLVVSKSGWTPTPWRLMLELERAYASEGLCFARHAVATTMVGTRLHDRALADRWLARFPLWDWVGGRTSVTSPVGLLPAALQGVEVTAFLRGAARMDELTRVRDVRLNPAIMLALMWYWLGHGRGDKQMTILPYRDRLALFPRYVQQLVMESVGKRLDRAGEVVQQGLTVYGNKGVTDQHAYLQQLIEGRADSFVVFVLAEKDLGQGSGNDTAFHFSLGDYLHSNYEGTRETLSAQGRDSITISIADTSPASLGALIALFERAVGLYAELINVNAYHQPSVNKDAAASALNLQSAALEYLRNAAAPCTAEEIAVAIEQDDHIETVYRMLRRQAVSPGGGIRIVPGEEPFAERFSAR